MRAFPFLANQPESFNVFNVIEKNQRKVSPNIETEMTGYEKFLEMYGK